MLLKIYSKTASAIFSAFNEPGNLADLLKANSFAQPNILTDNFAQRNGPKMP